MQHTLEMPHKVVVIPFLLEATAVLATLCFADAQSMTMERNENLIRNDLNIAKSYLIDVLPQ
ncbi:hypothetical protein EEJ34_01140 [Vibrio cholerae]|nr:hypothetical protein EEJ34_01140 [Vibrio cholerae]